MEDSLVFLYVTWINKGRTLCLYRVDVTHFENVSKDKILNFNIWYKFREWINGYSIYDCKYKRGIWNQDYINLVNEFLKEVKKASITHKYKFTGFGDLVVQTRK